MRLTRSSHPLLDSDVLILFLDNLGLLPRPSVPLRPTLPLSVAIPKRLPLALGPAA